MGIETRPFTAKARDRLARLSAFLLIAGFFGTTLPVPGQAIACSAANISVQRVSASVMYVDTGISPQLRGSYAGYKVTNNGAPITDAWVDITNFQGGVVNRAAHEDGRNHVGAMATGASAFAYFYLMASGSTGIAQTHDIAVYSGHPGLGGVQICTTGFAIQRVEETIKANANKVQTVVAGPNPAELGGEMKMTVTGQTGQVGSGPPGHPNGLGVFVGTPATEPGWRADAYQLVDVVMTFAGKGTYNDTLVVSGLNGAIYDYTAVYTFVAVGTTLAPTSVTPVNYIASGTQVKHTDTSGYTASLAPILPTENKLLLGKSASPTELPATGGTVIYTVTITNTGTVAATLDDVVDILPAGAAYVPGSARFKGSVIPDPYVVGQTISFVGFFGAAPGGGTAKLTYSATLPGTPGTYVNSATGHVGVEPIDTTFDTTNISPATASVQVGVLDVPPVANDDSANTSEDVAKIIDVLANDSDPNGNIDPTNVTVTVDPSNGTATPNLDGTITYTPAPNTNGADSFTYRVCDTTSPTPLCDTAVVTVNVTAVDDPPDAVNDSVETDEGTAATWNLISNDTDPEGNIVAATFGIVSGPSKGTLGNVGDGSVTYTPNAGYSGPDSLVYEICDSTGLCDTATVSITVNDINEPPVANPDSISTPEDVAVTVDVAANDTDPDGNLDPTSVRIPAGKEPANGTAVVNANGTITYTPSANFYGTDTFEYEICDTGDPVLCSTSSAIVTTTVVQVDDPPNALDENQSVDEDTAKTWTLSATDPDGNLDWGTLTIIDGPDKGTLIHNGSGSVTYTPANNYNGLDSFTYQVCDTTGLCDTATVSLTVTAGADPPVAMNDFVVTDEGVQATWNVAANDSDPDGDLDLDSITIVTGPTNGTVDSIGTGTITYTPTGIGTDSLVYEICDSTPTCVTATVNITINNLPDPPVAADEVVAADEDTPRTWTLDASDVDLNLDWTTLTIISGPSRGVLVHNGNGSVTYTPAQDYNGSDSFTYEVCDLTDLCDTATVSLSVAALPDPPVARNDAAATGEDNAVTINVIANDTDPDDDLVPGSVTVTAAPGKGTITNHGDGTVTYTPTANENGADSFTYQVCDSTPTCVTATVSIDIAAVNDLPTPQNDAFTIDEDAAATTWNLVSNDTDPDGNTDIVATSLTILSGPSNGVLANNADGTVTYTPAANFNGTDTIVYQVCDQANECATATVTIAVSTQPDPPVAKNDAATTPEDTPITVNVAANDSDIDGDLDLTSLVIVTAPAKGTATANNDGTITYTPAADDSGIYTIVYEICDGTAGTPLCDSATLTVTVTAEDDPPVTVDDVITVDEDGTETIDVTVNDTDVDGNLDPTTVTINGPAANGTAVSNADGTVTYTPNADYAGPDSFTYQVCDTTGLCDTGSVTVTVTGQADAPVTEDDDASVVEDGTVTVDVAFNDTDADGDLVPASVSIVSGPSNGTAVANGDGTITYTPAANWFGTDTIVYQICDSTAPTPECSQGTLTVEVTAVPDLPVANDDTALTAEDTPVVIDVVANDTDVDGDLDPTSVTISTPPGAGTVNVNTATGAITYYPPAEWSGTDVFAYQICDLGGNCENASITVVVYAVNDAPVVVNDQASVSEDGSVLIPVAANDSDIDNQLDPGTVAVVVVPAHGTANVNPVTGVVVYTPDPDYHGTDGFTYRICDVGAACSNGVVTVTVDPVNDAPRRLSLETVEIWLQGTPGPVLFSDPESDVYSVKLVSGNLPPGLTLLSDGSFGGRAEADGTYRATIEVCDVHGACSQSLLVVEVGAAALALLPFTGLALGGLGLVGVLLLLMGAALRKLGDDDHPEAQVTL